LHLRLATADGTVVNKAYRHEQILNVIRHHAVRTQDELSQELKALGVQVTQVTLSRDIREMGLVKGPRGYQEPMSIVEATVEEPSAFGRAMVEYVRDVLIAQNLVIIRTVRGTAAPVADAIDLEHWPEIVGTIAGEDTVFVATPDPRKAQEIRDRLLKLVR
jgi:transcriptional regulator of arginine metabolism